MVLFLLFVPFLRSTAKHSAYPMPEENVKKTKYIVTVNEGNHARKQNTLLQ